MSLEMPNTGGNDTGVNVREAGVSFQGDSDDLYRHLEGLLTEKLEVRGTDVAMFYLELVRIMRRGGDICEGLDKIGFYIDYPDVPLLMNSLAEWVQSSDDEAAYTTMPDFVRHISSAPGYSTETSFRPVPGELNKLSAVGIAVAAIADSMNNGQPGDLSSLEEAGDDTEEGGWQERALCAQIDPEIFFPEKGRSNQQAKRVCAGCDVRAECLEYALAHDEAHGVWGGLSERERHKLKSTERR